MFWLNAAVGLSIGPFVAHSRHWRRQRSTLLLVHRCECPNEAHFTMVANLETGPAAGRTFESSSWYDYA
eukprot:scaffold321872_cov35-Tisochrysis_lutea.AAC.2